MMMNLCASLVVVTNRVLLDLEQVFAPVATFGHWLPSKTMCEVDRLRLKPALANARQQGKEQHAAFKMIVKVGGAILAEAPNEFDKQTVQFGRGNVRPPFDWLQYKQKIFATSSVTNRNAMTWFTLSHFKWWFAIREGWGVDTCERKFTELLSTLPSGRISQDRKEILMPEKRQVLGDESRGHSEENAFGHRASRNPTPAQFRVQTGWMGHNHTALNDAVQYERGLGLGDGALQPLGSGRFSQELVPTHETAQFKAQLAEQQKAEAEIKK